MPYTTTNSSLNVKKYIAGNKKYIRACRIANVEYEGVWYITNRAYGHRSPTGIYYVTLTISLYKWSFKCLKKIVAFQMQAMKNVEPWITGWTDGGVADMVVQVAGQIDSFAPRLPAYTCGILKNHWWMKCLSTMVTRCFSSMRNGS